MLIRQSAFETTKPLLKGALHCHTTRSDGADNPADTIRYHAEHGYQFMALTDHRCYNRQNYAPETAITIIPGMEFDATFEKEKGFRCFHTVCIGPADERNPFTQDQRFDSGVASNQTEYQPYLDWLHQSHQLTVYCHPEWSSTPARYFDQLKGNFAMEIWNTGCAQDNGMDTNAAYWDELLGQGQRIYGVATDDGHHMGQHCVGYVMVNASNTVDAILAALAEGRFYSSCGPVIQDFYVEDGVAHVVCEPCATIQFCADKHPTVQFQEEGITHAMLDLRHQYDYIRVSVIDAQGRRAWTNPIFL